MSDYIMTNGDFITKNQESPFPTTHVVCKNNTTKKITLEPYGISDNDNAFITMLYNYENQWYFCNEIEINVGEEISIDFYLMAKDIIADTPPKLDIWAGDIAVDVKGDCEVIAIYESGYQYADLKFWGDCIITVKDKE